MALVQPNVEERLRRMELQLARVAPALESLVEATGAGATSNSGLNRLVNPVVSVRDAIQSTSEGLPAIEDRLQAIETAVEGIQTSLSSLSAGASSSRSIAYGNARLDRIDSALNSTANGLPGIRAAIDALTAAQTP